MYAYLYFVLVLVAVCNGNDLRSSICKQKNAYYKMDGSCDSYVECTDYIATEMTCPEGLNFDFLAKWPSYPCGYPQDVPCLNRGSAQPAQPTAECPHQYGFFVSPATRPDNCGQYRVCIAGHAIDMKCPTGLAFNPKTSHCDWPELVPSCDAEAFLRFTCPPAPLDEDGNPLDTVTNYKYMGNCFYFFSCDGGSARLLSCEQGLAFDPAVGHCINEELVNCKN